MVFPPAGFPPAGVEQPAAGPPWWRLQQGSRRPWRRSLAVAAGTAAVITVLGAPFGLLWHALAPEVPVIDAGDSGIVVNDPSPEQYIAADGWLTLLGIGFGLLVAIAAWLLLRRDRGPALLLGVVVGAGVATHWIAVPIGELIGKDAYAQWRATATQGATYLAPPEVHSIGPTLVPAFVAAIVLTLLAGWSNDPDLDQPGAQPGYGPNHPGTQPGYGPDLPGAQPGYGPGVPGAQPGFGPGLPGAQPGYGPGVPGAQPGYGPGTGQYGPVEEQRPLGADPLSSGWPGGPDPTAAPAPPAPGPADQPRG
ncbi:hypothetical protein GCM10010168_79900 [Actinoplanes ianthinogenes]|uniref:DUF2567 domain-containing protein n=2 Tax=Actinoplanes ianthinogenes TaxID=122358 RepID=A0ABM7M1P4_9ACTN|nr:hypothetical protein Aiant_61110 [Actinoplanes ianthinogenes]GGR49170.1 hypothetical protein GCM10010168_79900 [Actinoplanes ianthinogenes]